MAYEIPGRKLGTLLAAADLSTHQFKAAKINSSGLVALCSVAGERADGVIQNKPAQTQAVTLMVDGVSKMVAGGVIVIGAEVTVDNQGRVVASATGNAILGRALYGAGGAGEIIPVEVLRTGVT